ncbi:uncharacterized protein K452DRAFT_79741 [Aplosporella prunicola CBS 121167]|uniref:Uncharacterized protein n=1 Tax=Aplosporella prunicola CBS 121167 TaxID=1176127 RepID=A0A6A6B6I0_9PEZI|nr:uncharacterized protein K452DRAFT_79741 [Aplosporella prunicola CBS 121167]KAF2139023.1 hypothetical protein K452DRAFT_79741 [Aplosporella prunicola CBS 121167]
MHARTHHPLLLALKPIARCAAQHSPPALSVCLSFSLSPIVLLIACVLASRASCTILCKGREARPAHHARCCLPWVSGLSVAAVASRHPRVRARHVPTVVSHARGRGYAAELWWVGGWWWCWVLVCCGRWLELWGVGGRGLWWCLRGGEKVVGWMDGSKALLR